MKRNGSSRRAMWRRARSETSTAGGALAREGSTATLRLSPRLVNYTWWHRRGCRIKGDRRQESGARRIGGELLYKYLTLSPWMRSALPRELSGILWFGRKRITSPSAFTL